MLLMVRETGAPGGISSKHRDNTQSSQRKALPKLWILAVSNSANRCTTVLPVFNVFSRLPLCSACLWAQLSSPSVKQTHTPAALYDSPKAEERDRVSNVSWLLCFNRVLSSHPEYHHWLGAKHHCPTVDAPKETPENSKIEIKQRLKYMVAWARLVFYTLFSGGNCEYL